MARLGFVDTEGNVFNLNSSSSKKKYIDKLSYNQIPYIIYGTKSELGELLRKNDQEINRIFWSWLN